MNASAALTIKAHKRAILVGGDTLKVKDQLKGLGGSWNRGLQGWIFPGSRRQEVVTLLRAGACLEHPPPAGGCSKLTSLRALCVADATNTVVDSFGGGASKDADDANADEAAGESSSAAVKSEAPTGKKRARPPHANHDDEEDEDDAFEE